MSELVGRKACWFLSAHLEAPDRQSTGRMAKRQASRMGAAAQSLTPVAGDADLTSCPNCYLYFNYQVKGNNDLVPRLLSCGHLVCST